MGGFCTPGGLRAQPSRDDCRVFVESLGSLDAEALTQELEAKMVRGPALGAMLCASEACHAALGSKARRERSSCGSAPVVWGVQCVCVSVGCVCVGGSVGVCWGGRGCVPEPGCMVMLQGQACELLWA